MFILGKEKQLSTEDRTRQKLLLHAAFVVEIRNKHGKHTFEIFIALLINHVDDNDDNYGEYQVTIIFRANLFWL